MHCRRIPLVVALLAAVSIIAAAAAWADEGMWLFNQPPRKLLQERYGFVPTDAWMAHLQQSAVRFNNGGSGSFVSADGLVMTNHHIGEEALQNLSTKGHNLLRRATTPARPPRNSSAPTWN